MNRTLKILFISITILNSCCSSKRKSEKLKVIKAENKIDSFSDNNTSFNDLDKTEQILFEKKSNNEIWIYNCFNSEFAGETTLIKVNKNLKIKSVYYDYWTDVIDENLTEFKVVDSIISFNKNPFKSNGEIEFSYKLKVNEVSFISNKTINSKVISVKTKSKEITKENENKYKRKYGFINSFNAYKSKYVDRSPKILSNLDSLRRQLNPNFETNRIFILLTVDIKGNVLKESIKLRSRKKLTSEEENQIKNLIAEKINYKPGFINETPVNTELYLVI